MRAGRNPASHAPGILRNPLYLLWRSSAHVQLTCTVLKDGDRESTPAVQGSPLRVKIEVLSLDFLERYRHCWTSTGRVVLRRFWVLTGDRMFCTPVSETSIRVVEARPLFSRPSPPPAGDAPQRASVQPVRPGLMYRT